jgi:DNA-binding NarL/FixJ family response regulator
LVLLFIVLKYFSCSVFKIYAPHKLLNLSLEVMKLGRRLEIHELLAKDYTVEEIKDILKTSDKTIKKEVGRKLVFTKTTKI